MKRRDYSGLAGWEVQGKDNIVIMCSNGFHPRHCSPVFTPHRAGSATISTSVADPSAEDVDITIYGIHLTAIIGCRF